LTPIMKYLNILHITAALVFLVLACCTPIQSGPILDRLRPGNQHVYTKHHDHHHVVHKHQHENQYHRENQLSAAELQHIDASLDLHEYTSDHDDDDNDNDNEHSVFHIHNDGDTSSSWYGMRGDVTLTCVILGAGCLLCFMFRRKLRKLIQRPSLYTVLSQTPSRKAVVESKVRRMSLEKDALDLDADNSKARDELEKDIEIKTLNEASDILSKDYNTSNGNGYTKEYGSIA